MSDESHKENSDTKRLEMQIENLRCAIIVLIIVVSLLTGYTIIQSIQQYPIEYIASIGLFIVVALVVLLICSYSYATDRT